jgi:hypothetical protein
LELELEAHCQALKVKIEEQKGVLEGELNNCLNDKGFKDFAEKRMVGSDNTKKIE